MEVFYDKNKKCLLNNKQWAFLVKSYNGNYIFTKQFVEGQSSYLTSLLDEDIKSDFMIPEDRITENFILILTEGKSEKDYWFQHLEEFFYEDFKIDYKGSMEKYINLEDVITDDNNTLSEGIYNDKKLGRVKIYNVFEKTELNKEDAKDLLLY